MDIDKGDSPPVSSRPYMLPLKHYEWVQKELESLEWVGIITKSMSRWESPIVVVPKKSAPREPLKRRLCVNFRKVNELQQEVITSGKTKGQISIHFLPKIDEMYAKLKGSKAFSTVDLRSCLGKNSRAKTAFVMPFGKYKFLMVPFGLAQAPVYFQLLMNKVLEGLDYAMTYLDDIIIFSKNELEHLEHLKEVFRRLREAGLKMKHSKCDFFKSKIHYLGHIISAEEISPLPNKLDCISNMSAPKDVKEVKEFLGLTGYYRKFVPRFADILRPLTTLTKKDKKFEWTPECQKSFDLLKETLCGEPILKEYYGLNKHELLMMKVVDSGHGFHAIYLPAVLVFQVLQAAHDELGHNHFPRTYAALKTVFYWKGLEKDIRKHCKTCATCMIHRAENVKFKIKIFLPLLQPMDFICMDLIGKFHPPTSHGQCYALTAVVCLQILHGLYH